MKYVRTKEGIWKYNTKENSAERPNKEFGCSQIWLNIKQEDIIIQANTIEELIDAYIEEWDGKYFYIEKSNLWWGENGGFREYQFKYKEIKIFAAIWVTLPNKAPRLEPIAELNEKGELCLI